MQMEGKTLIIKRIFKKDGIKTTGVQ